MGIADNNRERLEYSKLRTIGPSGLPDQDEIESRFPPFPRLAPLLWEHDIKTQRTFTSPMLAPSKNVQSIITTIAQHMGPLMEIQIFAR